MCSVVIHGARCAPLFFGGLMRKVHIVRKDSLGIAMPELKQGWVNKRMQGGHAPVPFRQHSNNWTRANTFARVPAAKPWLD